MTYRIRKFFPALGAALFAAGLTASCSDDLEGAPGSGELTEAVFEVVRPDLSSQSSFQSSTPSRADTPGPGEYGTGASATVLSFVVYGPDNSVYCSSDNPGGVVSVTDRGGGSWHVRITVRKNTTLHAFFWAGAWRMNSGNAADPYTFDNSARNLSVDYAKSIAAGDLADAFCAWRTVTSGTAGTVQLVRPFCQVCIGTPADAYTEGEAIRTSFGLKTDTSTGMALQTRMGYDGSSGGYLPQTVTGAGGNQMFDSEQSGPGYASHVFPAVASGVPQRYIGMAYVLAPNYQQNVPAAYTAAAVNYGDEAPYMGGSSDFEVPAATAFAKSEGYLFKPNTRLVITGIKTAPDGYIAGNFAADATRDDKFWRDEHNTMRSTKIPFTAPDNYFRIEPYYPPDTPPSADYWFYHANKLAAITETTADMSVVGSYSHTFDGCSSLTDISGLENWDTGIATSFRSMFEGCSSMTDFSDINNWNTAAVTDASRMFEGCSSLTDLNCIWNLFATTSTRNLYGSPSQCAGTLDKPSVSLQNVSRMFDASGVTSTGAEEINVWDFTHVTDMSGMFAGCDGLTSVPILNRTTYNVTTTSRMFEGCSNLTSIGEMGAWYLPSLTNVSFMFKDCTSLVSAHIGVSQPFDVSNVTDFTGIFDGCTSLAKVDGLFSNIRATFDVSQLPVLDWDSIINLAQTDLATPPDGTSPTLVVPAEMYRQANAGAALNNLKTMCHAAGWQVGYREMGEVQVYVVP